MSVKFDVGQPTPFLEVGSYFTRFAKTLSFVSNIFFSSTKDLNNVDVKEKNISPIKNSKGLALLFVVGVGAAFLYSVYKKMDENAKTTNEDVKEKLEKPQHCLLPKKWSFIDYKNYIYQPDSIEEQQERFCHALQDLNTKYKKAANEKLKKESLVIAIKIIYFKQKEIKWGVAVSDLSPEFVRNIFLVQKEIFYKKTTYNPLSLLGELLFARPREVIPGESFPIILGDYSTP